jgi:hypothetical protein
MPVRYISLGVSDTSLADPDARPIVFSPRIERSFIREKATDPENAKESGPPQHFGGRRKVFPCLVQMQNVGS